MILTTKKILFFLFFFWLLLPHSFAQDKRFLNKLDSSHRSDHENTLHVMFSDIESAISSGNVAELSKYLGSPTYFSLSNGISGYYSANQAYYLLEDYFKIYQVRSFRLKNVSARGDNPYATGEYFFEFKGKRDSAQVYISLKLLGSGWKITQITIN